jgi:GT2 family glycosyltransferase
MTTRAPIGEPLTCSVIVCTRDRPEQLEKCLRGISEQTLKPFEIIVVDNAPLNGTAEEVSRQWGAKYVLEARLGLSRSRNTGAREASAEVVAYIDDDALARPDWLENLLPVFQSENVMAAGGRTLPPDADSEIRGLCQLIQGVGAGQAIVLDKSHPKWFEIAAFGGIAGGSNMAFRRSAFNEWPGFDLRLGLPHSGCEDLFAFLSLVKAGFQVAYLPDAVVMHPTACTVDGLKKHYLANAAHAISYVLFLFIHLPQHRGKLLKFVLEGMRGVRREWRGREAEPVDFQLGISAHKIYWARLLGVWLYVRSLIAAKA